MEKMELNAKSLMPTPKDGYHAVALLIEHGQSLIDALHIMDSMVRYPEDMDINKERVKKFTDKFRGTNF